MSFSFLNEILLLILPACNPVWYGTVQSMVAWDRVARVGYSFCTDSGFVSAWHICYPVSLCCAIRPSLWNQFKEMTASESVGGISNSKSMCPLFRFTLISLAISVLKSHSRLNKSWLPAKSPPTTQVAPATFKWSNCVLISRQKPRCPAPCVDFEEGHELKVCFDQSRSSRIWQPLTWDLVVRNYFHVVCNSPTKLSRRRPKWMIVQKLSVQVIHRLTEILKKEYLTVTGHCRREVGLAIFYTPTRT
jgi:hypothetical protein